MAIVDEQAVQVKRRIAPMVAQALIEQFDQRDFGLTQQLRCRGLVETVEQRQLLQPVQALLAVILPRIEGRCFAQMVRVARESTDLERDQRL
ncbi:hypothetical protein D3C77_521310 [compost metagenome]